MITFLLTLIVTALTFPRNFVDRSVKRRCADDKSKKHKPTCSVAVNNAKDAKDSEEGKLEQVEKNYAVHLWRFNFVMKGLRIILNDNFIKLALFHESEARRSTNNLAHRPRVKDESYNDTVELLPEISKDTTHPFTPAQSKAYVNDAKQLADIMYHSDAYFDRGFTDAEKAIDKHMEEWFKKDAVRNDTDPASDPNNLLMWLETMHPL